MEDPSFQFYEHINLVMIPITTASLYYIIIRESAGTSSEPCMTPQAVQELKLLKRTQKFPHSCLIWNQITIKDQALNLKAKMKGPSLQKSKLDIIWQQTRMKYGKCLLLFLLWFVESQTIPVGLQRSRDYSVKQHLLDQFSVTWRMKLKLPYKPQHANKSKLMPISETKKGCR